MHASDTRPRLLIAGIVLATVLVVTSCGGDGEPATPAPTEAERVVAELGLHGSAFAEPLAKPDFVLTDTEGGSFDFLEETRGQVTLLYFGYTNCPDVCPIHMANIAAALDQMPPELSGHVRVVFVGVDAPRDTPERVREWLDFFSEDFVGLTGTPDELEAAQLAAFVPVAFVDQQLEGGGYTVSHAGWLYLYTTDDLAHLRYPSGIRQSAWAHDLSVLVEDGWLS